MDVSNLTDEEFMNQQFGSGTLFKMEPTVETTTEGNQSADGGEDQSQQQEPVVNADNTSEQTSTTTARQDDATDAGETQTEADKAIAANEAAAKTATEIKAGTDPKQGQTAVTTTDPTTKPGATVAPNTEATTTTGVKDPSGSSTETPLDYKTLYEKSLAPIQANGKQIEIKSLDELRQLAQMGANYTKKMQEMSQHRKTLLMLENNGLLDPSKLSYLIDLDKKDPEAIKKLIKDAGIDPLEIDVGAQSAYQPGNHQVTDEESNFRSALSNVQAAPNGQETIQIVNSTWDQASKEVLWKTPEILEAINTHRSSGIYDQIATEVDRRKTLGQIPPGAAFIAAYKAVGDEMEAAGAFKNVVQPTTAQTPTVVATARPLAPKPMQNSQAAAAAGTTRSTPQKATPVIDYSKVSDDEFMNMMKTRV